MQLVKRHRGNASTYRNAVGKMGLRIGGPDNRLEFDADSSLYLPSRLVHDEATNHGGAGWIRHNEGPYRIAVNTVENKIRLFVVRGQPSKFVEISYLNPDAPLQVNQISDTVIEYYRQRPNVRRAFTINDRGLQSLITISEGYRGNGVFQFGFRLVGAGLTREGRRIKHNGKIVAKLPRSIMWDSNPDIMQGIKAVGEEYSADRITITADLTGCVMPCFVDPSIGPLSPTADTMLFNSTPTVNYGTNALSQVFKNAGTANRTARRFDISPIPVRSTIDSAALTEIIIAGVGLGGATIFDYHLFDLGKENWPELQATWNNFASGTPWTTGGGDYVALPYASPVFPLGIGAFVTAHAVGAQTALDSYSGIFSFIAKVQDESGVQRYFNSHSQNAAVPANRPVMDIIYTEAGGAVIPPHIFARVK